MGEREDGYYWVLMHAGDQPEIARWSRSQWWFPATHLPVAQHEVVVLSERLLPPNDWVV
jgi:hypothetical protein